MEENLDIQFDVADTKEKMEAFGRSLKPELAYRFFQRAGAAKETWKLDSLLIGFSEQAFSTLIHLATQKDLKILENEALTEPLQHHLTLLSHSIHRLLDDLSDQLEEETASISSINPLLLTPAQWDEIQLPLRESIYMLEDLHEQLIKALTIAWNTNRSDLITHFSDEKETIIRTIEWVRKLKREVRSHCEQVFAKLDDQDPATEALAMFSLWDSKDYLNAGIGRLEDLPLQSVREFKEEEIYSLPLLKEWLLSRH